MHTIYIHTYTYIDIDQYIIHECMHANYIIVVLVVVVVGIGVIILVILLIVVIIDA